MSEKIWFIEVNNQEVGEIITCDFCGSSFAMPKGVKLVVTNEWSPGQPLQKLVDATNPKLGRVAEPSEPSPEHLDALLVSVKERASAIKVEVGPGIAIGGLIGAGLGVAVGLTLHHCGLKLGQNDAFGQGFISLACGGVLGTLLGAIWWGRKSARGLAREMLREAIAKHRLDREKLRMAVLNNPAIPRSFLAFIDEPAR
jgi:hypothetical protein